MMFMYNPLIAPCKDDNNGIPATAFERAALGAADQNDPRTARRFDQDMG
jgi:hypothetical protein